MEINPQNVAPLEIYKILTGSILPRPIAWVSTLDSNGLKSAILQLGGTQ